MPYHVSIGVLCVLDGRDCTPGCDPLHRHALLSMEFTCAYRLKVPYRTKHRESSKELGSTFVFCVPMAYPNTTKQQVPHCYPLSTRYRVYSYKSGISPAGLGFHRRVGSGSSGPQHKQGCAIACYYRCVVCFVWQRFHSGVWAASPASTSLS